MITARELWSSGDPGKLVLGWAAWAGYRLIGCGLSKSPTLFGDLTDIINQHKDNLRDAGVYYDKRVFERMTPRGALVRKNAGDLLDVQLVAGALGTHWVSPAEWKGDCSREIEQNRTESVLGGDELKILLRAAPRGKNGKVRGEGHNVWSAVGIGLAHLGRWK